MLNIAEQHQISGIPSSLASEQPIPSIDAVNDLVASDMDAVNLLIQKRLHSDVALVNQVSSYIINSGGKRLRPVLVLLSARAFGYTGNQ
ncbi:MAG: polyprenyl synthetase family protein, partial [Gammaproteobacteria bacterium]|nr:polyprenyl synthetase family protein [Gammaproteobacteria bacterium]